MKKSAQRQRKHCALAVVRRSQKIFAPLQTPFPWARDSQNVNSRRWSLPSPTDQFGEDGCTQFPVIVVTELNRPTNKQTHTQTDRTDNNTQRC